MIWFLNSSCKARFCARKSRCSLFSVGAFWMVPLIEKAKIFSRLFDFQKLLRPAIISLEFRGSCLWSHFDSGEFYSSPRCFFHFEYSNTYMNLRRLYKIACFQLFFCLLGFLCGKLDPCLTLNWRWSNHWCESSESLGSFYLECRLPQETLEVFWGQWLRFLVVSFLSVFLKFSTF